MIMNFDDLIERKLVQIKRYPNGLGVVKYAKRVFYDGLWGEDDRLLDARGLVLDEEGNVIVWPFTKVFNHKERGTDLPLDTPVVYVEKVNGFLGCVTPTDKYGVIRSTTGSLDSDFALIILKHIDLECFEDVRNITYMFEIVDETDPHIIPTEPGAYLIGCRYHVDGRMMYEWELDRIAENFGWKRPKWSVGTFGFVLEQAAKCKHEGYMIRLHDEGERTVMKLKSPHYLSKKALMRLGSKQISNMFDNPELFRQRLDEEFYEVFDWLLDLGQEFWSSLDEQQRGKFLVDYFEGIGKNV